MGVVMRYAIVEDDVVVNVIEAEAQDPVPPGWVASDAAGPGWIDVDGTLTAPTLPEVFAVLTRYQFVRGLRANDVYAAVRGRFLLTEERTDRWENEIYWRRDDAMLEDIRTGASISEATMDQVFLDGAAAERATTTSASAVSAWRCEINRHWEVCSLSALVINRDSSSVAPAETSSRSTTSNAAPTAAVSASLIPTPSTAC